MFVCSPFCILCKDEITVKNRMTSYGTLTKRTYQLPICADCYPTTSKPQPAQLPAPDVEGMTFRQRKDHYRAIKQAMSCIHCGVSDHRVIDFHHVDPSTKLFGIACFMTDRSITKDQLAEELEKCVPLCSNCHRIYHYTRG